jgi:hypothetical protein
MFPGGVFISLEDNGLRNSINRIALLPCKHTEYPCNYNE